MGHVLLLEVVLQTSLSGLLIRVLLSAVAVFVAATLVRGVQLKGFTQAVLVAIVLAVLNATLGRILDFLALPLTFLTLGLFSLVIDAALLMLTSRLLDGFSIKRFWPAFWMALLLAIFTIFLHTF